MVQEANFAQAAAKPEAPADVPASSAPPRTYPEPVNHPENVDDIRKKFKSGKPNPLIAEDALTGVINAVQLLYSPSVRLTFVSRKRLQIA